MLTAAVIVASSLVTTASSFSIALPAASLPSTAYRRRAGSAGIHHTPTGLAAAAKKAGTFFNPVPDDDGDDGQDDGDGGSTGDKFEDDLTDILRRRRSPSRASEPSTINGVPTAEASKRGFGGTKRQSSGSGSSKKDYIPIGPTSLNDVTKLEYDDQGYTLYADEETGQKSRVFEALVEYPCEFTLKIVGANEGAFVEEMVAVVAECCAVEDVNEINHRIRINGKWISLTVDAPVQSAEMLYALYESVDRDPRVKFKF